MSYMQLIEILTEYGQNNVIKQKNWRTILKI